VPSLADIPDHLLKPTELLEFIHWLTEQPITYNAKHFLASAWSKYTGHKLEREHWKFLERHNFMGSS